jgi:hypothetical protein
MLCERVVETRVDQKVAKTGMVYPVHQYGEIARHMIAIGLSGARGIEIQTSVHVDNAGLKGS